jgi:hypothetical protein
MTKVRGPLALQEKIKKIMDLIGSFLFLLSTPLQYMVEYLPFSFSARCSLLDSQYPDSTGKYSRRAGSLPRTLILGPARTCQILGCGGICTCEGNKKPRIIPSGTRRKSPSRLRRDAPSCPDGYTETSKESLMVQCTCLGYRL